MANKVLHLQFNTAIWQYRLGAHKSSFAGKARGQQAEHESAVRTWENEGQVYKCCNSKSSHLVDGPDYFSSGAGENASGVLCPVLDSSLQTRHSHTGESQSDDKMIGVLRHTADVQRTRINS